MRNPTPDPCPEFGEGRQQGRSVLRPCEKTTWLQKVSSLNRIQVGRIAMHPYNHYKYFEAQIGEQMVAFLRGIS
jgi:hypothetical protein